MAKDKRFIGFGCDKEEPTAWHYFVLKNGDNMEIWEKYDYENKVNDKDILKIRVPIWKWKKVKDLLTGEFNRRLKEDNIPNAVFTQAGTHFERMFGKEMLVLFWAIQHTDNEHDINYAMMNWRGLQEEERWWLHMMTNAATGGIDDTKGWRKALYYIMCENPASGYPFV